MSVLRLVAMSILFWNQTEQISSYVLEHAHGTTPVVTRPITNGTILASNSVLCVSTNSSTPIIVTIKSETAFQVWLNGGTIVDSGFYSISLSQFPIINNSRTVYRGADITYTTEESAERPALSRLFNRSEFDTAQNTSMNGVMSITVNQQAQWLVVYARPQSTIFLSSDLRIGNPLFSTAEWLRLALNPETS